MSQVPPADKDASNGRGQYGEEGGRITSCAGVM